MPSPKENAFLQLWPTFSIKFLSIIEIICSLFLIFTELGNVASNFWITNVFAGDWCGLVMLIHSIMLFIIGCCLPRPKAAFRVVILTIVALVACALLISFDSIFIAQPSTCILTSSCSTNAVSTTIFSYYLQQNFLTTFNNLGPFQSYTTTQAKFLFQVIQIGVGCLCFALCLVYLGVYFFIMKKVDEQVKSSKQKRNQNSDASRPVPQETQKTDYRAPLPVPQETQKTDYRTPPPSLQQQQKDSNASRPSYQHKEEDYNPRRPSYEQQEKDFNTPRPSLQKQKKYFDAPWLSDQQKKASNGSGPSNQLQEKDFNASRPSYEHKELNDNPHRPSLRQEEKDFNAPRPLYQPLTRDIPVTSRPRRSQVVPAQVPEEAEKY